MARGDRLNARLLSLIDESAHELTAVYPPERKEATGTAPGAPPVSPLTGGAAATTVFPTAESPAQAAVTIQCLWYDSFGSVPGTLNRDRIEINRVGWRANAEVLACVKVSDAALDPDDPSGDTIFTAASHVLHGSHRYRVLGTDPLSRGWSVPITMYVWLTGAQKQ